MTSSSPTSTPEPTETPLNPQRARVRAATIRLRQKNVGLVLMLFLSISFYFTGPLVLNFLLVPINGGGPLIQFDYYSRIGALGLFATSLLVYFLFNYLQYGVILVTAARLPLLLKSRLVFVPRNPNSSSRTSATDTGTGANWKGADPQLVVTAERLNREIIALGRRGNVSLVIGVVTTLAGVGVLAFVVFGESEIDPNDHWKYLVHFLLRLSIALFIEVFAYFFLRLYKTGLDDIKFYQNEITNVELKWSALRVADQTKSPALLKIVLDSLAKTERNFVLKKGESTLGLERERLEKNEFLDFMKTVAGARKSAKD